MEEGLDLPAEIRVDPTTTTTMMMQRWAERREDPPTTMRRSIVVEHQCYLADQILIEILHRLPIKSIFSFKCVSKNWLALLSNPYFIRRYVEATSRSETPPPWNLFFQYYSPDENQQGMRLTSIALPEVPAQFREYDGFSLSFLPSPAPNQKPQESLMFLASSNGLILLCCALLDFHRFYYVCNPLTKKWVTLPEPPRLYSFVRIGFICEVSSSSPPSTHYKVVRVQDSGRQSQILDVEIFSSETGKWRYFRVLCPDTVIMYPFHHHAVPYNGILHWLDTQDKILAIDPKIPNHNSSKQCRSINLHMVQTEDSNDYSVCLGVLEGRFCVIKLTKLMLDEICELTVWVLKDYDRDEWCLELKTEVRDGGRREWVPLAFHPLDRNVVFLKCINYIASYNIQSRRLEVICSHRDYFKWSMIFPFVPPPWPTQLPPRTWITPYE